jgi:hypothetical protein
LGWGACFLKVGGLILVGWNILLILLAYKRIISINIVIQVIWQRYSMISGKRMNMPKKKGHSAFVQSAEGRFDEIFSEARSRSKGFILGDSQTPEGARTVDVGAH